MNLTEKAAYIRGLAEGMELPDSKEGRIIKELLTLVSELAEEVHDIDESVMELGDELDGLAEEVGDLYDLEDEDEDEDEDLYEITCPDCGEKIFLDYDELCEEPSVTCPACGADICIDVPCDGDCSACDTPCEAAGDGEDK